MTTEIVKTDTTPAPPPAFSPAAAHRLALAERALYGAGGVLAAVGPQTDAWALHAAALGTGAGALWRLWSRTRDGDRSRLLTACHKALPVLGLSGCYAAALAVPGLSWWEVAAPVLTAALAGLAAPLTRSRGLRRAVDTLPERIAAQEPAQAPQNAPEEMDPADAYHAGLRRLWDASPATGDTSLTGILQYSPDRPDFEAVILARPGEAVPPALATPRAIAAVFDVPEEAVALAGVAGYGPGRLAVRVAPSLAAADHQEQARPADDAEELWAAFTGGRGEALWHTYVSPVGGAAPGVELVAHRVEEDRITLRIAAPRGKTLRLDQAALCSALGIDDTSRMVVEGTGPREAIVYVYRTNPLLHVRPPTAEDLTMDDRGRISLGVCHDGKPARIMLFNPDTGRAQNGLTAGTTGAGKSGLMRLLGAAQRRSGVISWMADVQGGMSMPEMDGRIDWFARGQAETMLQLRTLHAVKVYRETESARYGRGDFDIRGPWRLIQWTGDEINRLLSSLDDKVRKEAAWLISDLQRTGHKVGIGVDLAVQSLHLKELGDNHEIREKGKEGHVVLLRTASSSTQGMGLDGIAPDGAHITNVPERIYEASSAAALFDGEDQAEGVPTPGMGWLIAEGKAVLMRTFTLQKVDGRFPLLEELMDSVPLPTLTPEEAAVAGSAYANRHRRGGAAPAAEVAQEPEETAPPEAPDAPSFAKEPTLKERILAALEGHPEGLPLREIRRVVGCGTDGGPTTGGVNNAVSQLAAEGRLIACGNAVYRLP